MSTLRGRCRRRRQVRVGAPDASLTGAAGLAAVTGLVDRLGVIAASDAGIGPIEQRDRGLSGGELMIALACCQMTGGDFLVALDRRRADTAGERLGPARTPASTTAAALARRLDAARRAGIEAGSRRSWPGCSRWSIRPPRRAAGHADHRHRRHRGRGLRLDKRGVAYNYKGQRAGRPHAACRAEAGVVLAADLLGGREDPRRGAAALLRRALAALPAQTGRPRMRADIGYFAADIAHAAVGAGCDFSIGATRNPAAWRAAAGITRPAG